MLCIIRFMRSGGAFCYEFNLGNSFLASLTATVEQHGSRCDNIWLLRHYLGGECGGKTGHELRMPCYVGLVATGDVVGAVLVVDMRVELRY